MACLYFIIPQEHTAVWGAVNRQRRRDDGGRFGESFSVFVLFCFVWFFFFLLLSAHEHTPTVSSAVPPWRRE